MPDKSWCAPTCYVVGSVASFVSVVTTFLAIHSSPQNTAFAATAVLLSFSFALKLAYYNDKPLAFAVNAMLSISWLFAFFFALWMLHMSRH